MKGEERRGPREVKEAQENILPRGASGSSQAARTQRAGQHNGGYGERWIYKQNKTGVF